ncbi:MAG: chemotaxis response regulator protein-glutamate methylesterase [Candidatus Kapabacteria bacterium]|nr:chemotaxis response regulator protein-glutamate methylesterase [Candidatus Kapabacteria bacterium]
MEKIKVLIVDDSVFMRSTLSRILAVPEIQIVGTAENGKIGVEKALELKPDIITMDIEMPIMNGLDALSEIMKKFPTPVIMISSLTTEGAESTLDALSRGAIDFVGKRPAFNEMWGMKEEIIDKVINIGTNESIKSKFNIKRKYKQLSHAEGKEEQTKIVQQLNSAISKRVNTDKLHELSGRSRSDINHIAVIGIGISTGGPMALIELFKTLPDNLPPILIAQHMPEHFTLSFANRLNSLYKIKVKEAEDNDNIMNGCAYVAPGGRQMTINKFKKIKITDSAEFLYKPCVNNLFESMVNVYGSSMLGVIMTGMGNDGMESMKKLHQTGGWCVAQEPDSCVVSGMVRSVLNANAVDEIFPLEEMGKAITNICQKK